MRAYEFFAIGNILATVILIKQKYNKSVIHLAEIKYKYVISDCISCSHCIYYNNKVILQPQNHNKSVMEDEIWND